MRVCLFLIVPIVIVSALQQESNTHLFTKFNRYSGYACHAQYRVFDIREARSRSDCAIACANVHGCSAISHVESLKRCIGCNSTTFDMADVLENVTGRCPEGWKRYSKSCYYLNFKITMNFTAAKTASTSTSLLRALEHTLAQRVVLSYVFKPSQLYSFDGRH
ncbi:hypothetical protein DPMN_118963 [Dreissena polymorpha]|uniref:Secreted protein n=1 Tax=Dreissena polymorpha TaxID=45954 RepID=A0A9D4JQS9_DREPO|nr:hypothetical protein DPMN_118963 [Dreissena polymorpha]